MVETGLEKKILNIFKPFGLVEVLENIVLLAYNHSYDLDRLIEWSSIHLDQQDHFKTAN